MRKETTIGKAAEVVLSPSRLTEQKTLERRILTPRQQALKNSLTDSQLVNEWGGTVAQLKCNVSLRDVILQSEYIPTLTDVNIVFSNATSVRIITQHLQSVLQFSGVELTDKQLGETALAILTNYWFLNLAELCIFFSQLKAGSRGQFVWGAKINNQAIMVALNDFCRDRRTEIDAVERIKQREQRELCHSKIENAAAAIVAGIDQLKDIKNRAKEDFTAFCELFPLLPDAFPPETWWKAWKGEREYQCNIYGPNCPPADIASIDIGKYLCEFNIQINKKNG